jgi:hypothetical protein
MAARRHIYVMKGLSKVYLGGRRILDTHPLAATWAGGDRGTLNGRDAPSSVSKWMSLAAALIVLMLTCASQSAAGQLSDVSLSKLDIASDERIVGFNVILRAGRIHSLREVRLGWHVEIDNDPSWNTKAAGRIHVGAAAVDPDFFDRFLAIETYERDDAVPFSIDVKVYVTKDFATVREITVPVEDISIVAR